MSKVLCPRTQRIVPGQRSNLEQWLKVVVVLKKSYGPWLEEIAREEMADLGEGPREIRPPPALPPLYWMKKEEMTKRRKAGWAS